MTRIGDYRRVRLDTTVSLHLFQFNSALQSRYDSLR